MSSPRFYVRLGAEVRGPLGLAQLREMAEVGAVTRTTEAAPEEGGAWVQLGTLAESRAIFPGRATLGFKPTSFEVANSRSAAPVDLREIIAATRVEGPVLRLRPQPATQPPTELPRPHPPLDAAGEVEAMVQEVARREAEFAPPPPPPPKPKPNQRLRLVVMLSVIGNAIFAGILTYYRAWSHDLSVLITSGIAVIYHGGLAIIYFALPKG